MAKPIATVVRWTSTGGPVTADNVQDAIAQLEGMVSGSVAPHASTHESGGSDPIASLPTAAEKAALTAADAPSGGNPLITQTGLEKTLVPACTVSQLPSPGSVPIGTQALMVTDAYGGESPAYNDGTNWRREDNHQLVYKGEDLAGRRMTLGVPLYIYPPTGWTTYTALGQPAVHLAVLNPDSGPGIIVDPGYFNAMLALQATGAKVIGYVPTTYGGRAANLVKLDIDTYFALYPKIDGIFFDEVADGQFSYYEDLWNYVLTKPYPQQYVALNPGATVAESYMTISSSIILFEDAASNYLSWVNPPWMAKYDRQRIWHIIHTLTSVGQMQNLFDRAMELNVGTIFLTDDIEPNPYDTVPTYQSQIVDKLATTGGDDKLISIPGRAGEWWAKDAAVSLGNITSIPDQAAVPEDLSVVTGSIPLVAGPAADQAASFTGAQQIRTSSFAPTRPAGSLMVVYVVFKTSVPDKVIIGGTSAQFAIYTTGAGCTVDYYAGSFIGGTIDVVGEWAIALAVLDNSGTHCQLRVNGKVSTTTNPGAGQPDRISLGDYADFGNAATADILMAGVHFIDPANLDRDIPRIEAVLSAATGIPVVAGNGGLTGPLWVAKYAAFTIYATDNNRIFDCFGTFAITLPGVGELSPGFRVYIRTASGTQTITGSEDINLNPNLVISTAESMWELIATRTAWDAVVQNSDVGAVADHGASHEAAGSDPVPSIPTVNEKAAMTASSSPGSGNAFITHSALVARVSDNVAVALAGAASPSGGNVFITATDVVDLPTNAEKDALDAAASPNISNPYITASAFDARLAQTLIPPCVIASLPSPGSTPVNAIGYATDADGGAVPVYNSGFDWLRFDNNQIVAVPPDFSGKLMSKSIPLYTTPPSSVWNAYTAEGFPDVAYVVFTPDAGTDGAGGRGPGSAQIPAFQTVILAAQAAGIKVIGYIATDYATREYSDVFTAIDNFYSFYPTIDGIFFDTVANNQFVYYYNIRQHFIHRPRNLMVLNPGTTTIESYMQICDVICNYENDYTTYLTFTPPDWQVNYPMRRFWHFIHDCPGSTEATIAMGIAQQNNVGNIFITDGTEPFPWTPLSAFETEMTTYVDGTNAAFSLINIPGRIGEWWADNVTKDGSDLVSQVDDHAAIVHHMTASGAQRPLWVNSVLNGHPILRFTGTQWVQTPTWNVNQPFTIAVVYSATANDVIAVGGAAVGLYDGSGVASYTAGSFVGGTINVHSTFAIIVGVFSDASGSSQLRVNGAQASTTTPGNFGFTALALGAYAGGSNAFQGDVAGAVVFNRALDPTSISQLESYLAAKYAITI